MKSSIAIATFLVAAAGAAGVAALPNPWKGSDTLYSITHAVISGQPAPLNGDSADYVGGGSGGGDTAMAANPPTTATQQTAPMSRMIKSEGNVCTYNGGTAGSGNHGSAGVVIALDAVDLFSATTAGGSSSCQGPSDAQSNDNQGFGLKYSGSSTVFVGTTGIAPANQTWKWALALLYGGYDFSYAGGGPNGFADCGQASRKTLVSSWNNLFQPAACTNSNAACQALVCVSSAGAVDSTGNAACFASTATTSTACGAAGGTCKPGPTNPGGTTGGAGPLWHAFRRDDTSGTSDVFSSIIGIQSPTFKPLNAALSISSSNNNGFGTSPYCNALNANNLSSNTSTPCHAGPNMQYVGPGGVPDPVSDPTGALGWRRPPPGAWGDAPDPSQQQVNSADVFPTQFQDNDPIRRPCLGSGHFAYSPYNRSGTGNYVVPGEEVCNIDQALGLVLPMPDTDQLGVPQYPSTAQGAFIYGKGFAPTVLTCPAFGSWAAHTVQTHFGECPNGDATAAGQCAIPADNSPATTTLVFSDKSTIDPSPIRPGCAGQYGSTTAASKAANALTTNVQLICSDGGGLNDDTAGNTTCAAVGATTSTVCGSAAFGGPGTCIAANLNNTTPANSGCLASQGSPDGRAYNAFLWNGSPTTVKYAQYAIPAISQTTFDFTAAYSRIHQYETALGGNAGVGAASGCQYADMTDQIGCLSQADPCSIGYAGDAAKFDAVPGGVANGIATNPSPNGGTNGTLGTFDSARVAQVYPGTNTVQLLGLGGEYQLSRKLYFNSLVGFAQLPNAAWADNGTDELTIANYEAQTVSAADTTAMQTIITNNKEFLLGFQSGKLSSGNATFTTAAGSPFCEDFNEQLICNNTATAAANVNGCTLNGPGVGMAATANTVCGDGIRGPYEECDNGTLEFPANGHATGNSGSDLTAGGCSTTCRCNNDFVTNPAVLVCSDGSAGGNATCAASGATLGEACGTAAGAQCVASGSCN